MHRQRLLFLDQVRGYAIFGMILVNFLGMFDVMPWTFKHHVQGFSYADHIAPLFIFIVGFGYRMSFTKAVARDGLSFARSRSIRRYALISGLGLLYGGFNLRVSVWDALLDIGLSGLLALPFMHLSTKARMGAACAFLAGYQAVFSRTGYGDWVVENSINGGPLGPLSWVFILLMGTAAYDLSAGADHKHRIVRFFSIGLFITIAGVLLRAEWPWLKLIWPFSAYAMTTPYPVYASGLCFLTVLLFYLSAEIFQVPIPFLTTLGKNPLVIYLLQAVLVLVMGGIVDTSMTVVPALALFAILVGICYGAARYLEVTGRIIKIG
ncbi:MAG: hypothetical protein BWX80_00722 [Candidatus Hydrogenedentes bacterium ADurb.Bin101]|jgi:predicted acyltransferase|nr:MAG: hypothetical protein BWX80_00722 [Candidatus Hydrogenedentes bacterium ADurb.Bin101]HOC68604.1 heparan-alpha-glucosaminide N-acetyltransferase domain-containing protein [Candidatus Hydrogenedentota bacterium]